MIISCPECAGPFEVPDDRIAVLVQVACPHCAFRMILDFAAANDPGLVEQGMRMASGFLSAADYHASVQPAAVSVEAEAVGVEATYDEPAAPALEIVPPTSVAPVAESVPPVRVRPEPVAQPEPPVRVRPEPVSPAASSPRPLAATPSREPVRPAAETRPVSEEARTEVHMLPRGAERMVPVDIPPVRRPPVRPVDDEDIAVNVPAPATEIVRTTTVVGPPPTPPAAEDVAIDFDDDEDESEATTTDRRPLQPASAEDEAAHPAFGSEEDEDVPTMVVTPETREAARRDIEAMSARRPQPQPEPEVDRTPSGRERPRPPHTPPGRAKVTARDEEAPTAAVERPGRRPEPMDDEAETGRQPPVVTKAPEVVDDELEQERMSTFGVVVVVLLLLIAGGLVGASVALNEDHSPDPRPLLEKLYRQYVKGEQAPAQAEPAAKPAAK